jgi:hypothetical protein
MTFDANMLSVALSFNIQLAFDANMLIVALPRSSSRQATSALLSWSSVT